MTTIDPVQFGILIGKLDAIHSKIDEHIADDKRVHEAQEKRIAALEATDNQAKGGAKAYATIASIVGAISGAIGSAIAGYFGLRA